MALPLDFQSLVDPNDVRHDKRWATLIHNRYAAYQRRFFVHGYADAAQTLGFTSVKALWASLKDACPTSHLKGGPSPVAGLIFRSLPTQWRDALPDINDRGDAKPQTTYWREFSALQLMNAWEGDAQTLLKALQAIAALTAIAEHRKLKGKAADVWTAVTIRPSVFWLVDYTESIYARCIAKDVETMSDAYTACGLEFDLAPGVRSDVLMKAADGQETLTFTTAERLRAWLGKQGIVSGPVRVMPNADRVSAAAEVPATEDALA